MNRSASSTRSAGTRAVPSSLGMPVKNWRKRKMKKGEAAIPHKNQGQYELVKLVYNPLERWKTGAYKVVPVETFSYERHAP